MAMYRFGDDSAYSGSEDAMRKNIQMKQMGRTNGMVIPLVWRVQTGYPHAIRTLEHQPKAQSQANLPKAGDAIVSRVVETATGRRERRSPSADPPP